MSTGKPLPFREAYGLAEDVAAELRPLVVRLKAGGSLRRRRPHVSDIEFVAEPRMVEVDLFGAMAPVVDPIRKRLEELGTWVKGADRMMQITDLFGRPGLKCEVYLVHPPAQWGSQLAIRTGPWELGRHAVTVMRDRGYRHDEGHAIEISTDRTVPTPTEEDFFALAGLPCWPPSRRDDLIARIQAGEREFAPA